MSETVTVYGFGTYFGARENPSDIDLLVVHLSTTRQSCEFAICCKKLILQAFPNADVTLLSEQEADGSQFIVRSGALALTQVCSDLLREQMSTLFELIGSYRSPVQTGLSHKT